MRREGKSPLFWTIKAVFMLASLGVIWKGLGNLGGTTGSAISNGFAGTGVGVIEIVTGLLLVGLVILRISSS